MSSTIFFVFLFFVFGYLLKAWRFMLFYPVGGFGLLFIWLDLLGAAPLYAHPIGWIWAISALAMLIDAKIENKKRLRKFSDC